MPNTRSAAANRTNGYRALSVVAGRVLSGTPVKNYSTDP